MSRFLFVVAALLSPLAGAKPWQGIHPAASSAIDVIGKFGEPSKKVTARGQEVLVYTGAKAIKGTVQAQFKCDPETKEVKRIDVYPEPVIDLAAIEASYGKACDPAKPVEPCYYQKETPQKQVYLLYLKLGLAIFFKDDGKTVQSFAFLPPQP